MTFITQPNVTLTDTWSVIVQGAASATLQLLGSEAALIAIGVAAPAASSQDGHLLLSSIGRDCFPISGLAGESVYGRTRYTGTTTVVAVTKG